MGVAPRALCQQWGHIAEPFELVLRRCSGKGRRCEAMGPHQHKSQRRLCAVGQDVCNQCRHQVAKSAPPPFPLLISSTPLHDAFFNRFFTPEQIFLGTDETLPPLKGFDPRPLKPDEKGGVIGAQLAAEGKKEGGGAEMLIMVGFPGSGKTTFARRFLESAGVYAMSICVWVLGCCGTACVVKSAGCCTVTMFTQAYLSSDGTCIFWQGVLAKN